MTASPTRYWRSAAVMLAGALLAGAFAGGAQAQLRVIEEEEAGDPSGLPAVPGTNGEEGVQSSDLPEGPDGGATGAPMSILPGPKVPPPEEPVAEGPDGPPDGVPDDGPLSDDGVQIGSLGQLDPSTIGTLNENNGGFAWTLWQDSDLTLIRTFMQQMPGALRSPALQDLSRRVLLTAAAVPEQKTQPPAGTDTPSLLTVRLGRLAAAGRLEDSARLLERVAPFSVSPALEERRADIHLLQGDVDQACGLAETALQRSGADYWLRLSAFCDVQAGNVDAAGRTLDLLAESGATDPLYDALLSRLLSGQTGSAPEGMSMADVSPLVFAMLGALDAPLNAEILLSSSPMLLSAVAGSENAAPTVRLEALEQAVGIGALPLERLQQAYMAQRFTEAQKAGAMDRLYEGGGAELNAMLYQLVAESGDAASRLNLLSEALDLARRQGQFLLMARVYLEATRSIEPAPEFLSHAGNVVRTLLLGGATDRAFAWYELVRREASGSSGEDLTSTGTLLDIWPLFHLAARDTGAPYSDQILGLWWQAQVTTVGEERVRRGRLLFSLLEALDYKVPERFWIELSGAPARVAERAPSVAHWRAMLRAGAAGRVGETVLASLDGLGGEGLSKASLSSLSSVIGLYRQIGLIPEADRIAVEAAIMRGL